MLPPIRCFSCNKVLSPLYILYESMLKENVSKKDAMDRLQLNRYCCRRMMMGYVDMFETISEHDPTKLSFLIDPTSNQQILQSNVYTSNNISITHEQEDDGLDDLNPLEDNIDHMDVDDVDIDIEIDRDNDNDDYMEDGME